MSVFKRGKTSNKIAYRVEIFTVIFVELSLTPSSRGSIWSNFTKILCTESREKNGVVLNERHDANDITYYRAPGMASRDRNARDLSLTSTFPSSLPPPFLSLSLYLLFLWRWKAWTRVEPLRSGGRRVEGGGREPTPARLHAPRWNKVDQYNPAVLFSGIPFTRRRAKSPSWLTNQRNFKERNK